MKIALVQPVVDRKMDNNLKKTLRFMEKAAANKAQVICFPEVQFSPFFPQFQGQDASKYAISIDHNIMTQLREKSKELGLICVPNIYLKDGNNTFDASPVISSNGTILGISKMVHIAQFPCFYEQDYYTPSDDGFFVYDTPMGKIGIVICFDRHIPESIRTCVLKGAQIIIIPTVNTKTEPMEMFEWELRVPAMQNSIFIAMCNRVGKEDQMDFAGESLVVGPDGSVIAKADDREQILYADIDLDLIEINRKQKPHLELRKPEFYKN